MSARLFNDTATVLNGTPVYLGKIAASTTKNNHDTAAPFNDTGNGLAGKTILIQADAACNVAPGTTNAATATTDTGVGLVQNEKMIICMGASYGWLAVVGNANVHVWELV